MDAWRFIKAKNLILYMGIVAALSWTFYSLFQVQTYREFLRNEAPHCTLENENRELIFLLTLITLTLLQRQIEVRSRNLFQKILSEKKFPSGSKLRVAKATLLGERVFKLTTSALCVSLLYAIMLQDDCNFLDVRVGGQTDRPLYFQDHPCQQLPRHLDNFYIFKLTYHFYELLYTLLVDRHRSDFPEYVLHHFLTFTLILFSYSVNYLPVGAAVMILHDVTDLGATIFKMVVDVTPFFLQIIAYALMVVSWLYFRIWFFPAHVINRILEESASDWHHKTFNLNFVAMLTTFLIALYLMHIFWFYIMVKGLIRRFRNSNYRDNVSLKNSENRI